MRSVLSARPCGFNLCALLSLLLLPVTLMICGIRTLPNSDEDGVYEVKQGVDPCAVAMPP